MSVTNVVVDPIAQMRRRFPDQPWLWLAGLGGIFFSLLLIIAALAPESVASEIPFLQAFSGDAVSALTTFVVFVFTFSMGFMAALSADRRLTRESLLGRHIDEKIDRALSEARIVGGHKVAVDHLTTYLIENVASFRSLDPNNSLHKRIVESIQLDAQVMRFDPVQVVIERFGAEIFAGGPHIKSWQQIAVRVGILATFYGLLRALSPLKSILNAKAAQVASGALAPEKISGLVASIVEYLSVAFGASIAGLVSALLLQIALSSLRSKESKFTHELAKRVAKIQELASIARNDSPLAQTIEVLKGELNKHANEIDAAASMMKAGFSTMAANAAAVATTKERLLEILERQNQAAERGMQLAETLSTVDDRLKHLFDARLTAATSASSELAHSTAAVIRTVGTEIMAEVRSGYGRDAKSKFEEEISARLDRAIDALERQDERRLRTVILVAQLLAIGVGLALVVVIGAGGFIYAAGSRT